MKNHSLTEEMKKVLAYTLRLYAEHPSLTKEYNEHKPEWNDEKAFNETACCLVQIMEK